MKSLIWALIALPLLTCGAYSQSTNTADAWLEVVKHALVISEAQTGAKPLVERNCTAAIKGCMTVVSYVDEENHLIKIATHLDTNEQIVARLVCKLNGLLDIMHCVNFDTSEKLTYVKNYKTGEFEYVR